MTGVCKFCGCTEERPCLIPLSQERFDGMEGVAVLGVLQLGQLQPCAWLLEDVCDAPKCVERAYLDARLNAEELTQRLEEGMRFEIEPGEVA